MTKFAGNKGEWSEIYVFLRLLATGKLYAADADLNKIDDIWYTVLNIVRNEAVGELEFRLDRTRNVVSVITAQSNTLLSDVPVSEFQSHADWLLSQINAPQSAAFSEDETEKFLRRLNIGTIKAKSADKADIKIKIHDLYTGYNAVQGFSIKSRLGGASTLINAGKTTNFIYEVTGPVTAAVKDRFNNDFKQFRQKFDYLLNDVGCGLVYAGMENKTYRDNLRLIDGDLPAICAHMLVEYYATEKISVSDILQATIDDNPLHYNLANGHPFYQYKFKKLLTDSALGMLPSKIWNGTADATGGYIIVREDGEVLCYHLFNRNAFEDYLISNTRFETGSTGRHQFGSIYEENGRYYLKLNLQIRFIK